MNFLVYGISAVIGVGVWVYFIPIVPLALMAVLTSVLFMLLLMLEALDK